MVAQPGVRGARFKELLQLAVVTRLVAHRLSGERLEQDPAKRGSGRLTLCVPSDVDVNSVRVCADRRNGPDSDATTACGGSHSVTVNLRCVSKPRRTVRMSATDPRPGGPGVTNRAASDMRRTRGELNRSSENAQTSSTGRRMVTVDSRCW
jgi:hypothetical protein